MNNTSFNNFSNFNNGQNQTANKPKTMVIDARFKEIYYRPEVQEIKESVEAIAHRHTFWNYMVHVSMQNTVSQMRKRIKAAA